MRISKHRLRQLINEELIRAKTLHEGASQLYKLDGAMEGEAVLTKNVPGIDYPESGSYANEKYFVKSGGVLGSIVRKQDPYTYDEDGDKWIVASAPESRKSAIGKRTSDTSGGTAAMEAEPGGADDGTPVVNGVALTYDDIDVFLNKLTLVQYAENFLDQKAYQDRGGFWSSTNMFVTSGPFQDTQEMSGAWVMPGTTLIGDVDAMMEKLSRFYFSDAHTTRKDRDGNPLTYSNSVIWAAELGYQSSNRNACDTPGWQQGDRCKFENTLPINHIYPQSQFIKAYNQHSGNPTKQMQFFEDALFDILDMAYVVEMMLEGELSIPIISGINDGGV